jgi:hypothetical protein
MSVIDTRPGLAANPNVDLAVGVDEAKVRQYIDLVLHRAA